MRRAVHLLALVATAAALVAAAPGRCGAEAHHAPPPTEALAAPPCHESPEPEPTDRPCPATPDGAVAACCATPAAPVAVHASVPAPAVTALPALVAMWERGATTETPVRPVAWAPDRPPGASRALLGCFRI